MRYTRILVDSVRKLDLPVDLIEKLHVGDRRFHPWHSLSKEPAWAAEDLHVPVHVGIPTVDATRGRRRLTRRYSISYACLSLKLIIYS